MDEQRVYLDYNSTTPIDPRVLEAMLPFLSTKYGNPASRDHAFGWDAAEAVEDARHHVANLINAKSREIVFTSGATESINLVLKGLRRSSRRAIVTAVTEHEAVLGSCRQLETTGIEVTYLPVDGAGHVDPVQVEDVARKRDTVIALMAVNNEIGTTTSLVPIVTLARSTGAVVFTDATQAIGKFPIDVRDIGVDFAAFSAHKVYGPKGVGALFVRGGAPESGVEPLIAGGGQEWKLRGGTLNVAGIVGFGEACRIAQLEMHDDVERMRRLRDRFEEALLAALPDLRMNGDPLHRIANTSNVTFVGVQARTLLRDMYFVAASTSSACSSSSAGPSHVLKALGMTDDEAYSSVRFSLGRFTIEAEIEFALDRIIESVRRLRRCSRDPIQS
jgi:cysteine desulfurase